MVSIYKALINEKLCPQRSLEVVGDMEELLEWLRTVDAQLRDAEPPSCEPDLVRAQLKEQRPLNDEVAAQRVRVRDLLSQAKKVTITIFL